LVKEAYHEKKVAVREFMLNADDQLLKDYFRKEVRTFSVAGQHPNIVGLEGVTKEEMCLVMEFCPSTLTKVNASLSLVEKLARIMEVCRGIAFLHKMGIVHGDLKPANVLISINGIAKLTDFGLSANVYSTKGKVSGGTVRYVAPETSNSCFLDYV
jgi:serine/threonine protein kinase